MCRPAVYLILIITTCLTKGTDVRALSTTAYDSSLPTSTNYDTHKASLRRRRCLPMSTDPQTKSANYDCRQPSPPANIVIPTPTTAYASAIPIFADHDIHGGPLRRQNPVTSIPTTSSTYDFWWPFPPANVPTPTPTTPPGTIAPILISIIPDATSLSSNTSSVNPSPSGSSSSSSLSSSSSHSLSSASASSTANAVTAVTFRLIDLVPAFAVVGVFVIGLALWFLYGCCTRKPRVRADEDELLCGPRYVGIDGTTSRRDVEEQGPDDSMLYIPRYGRGRGLSGQFRAFRWPSFSEPPAFNPSTGFHVPDEYKQDEDDPLTSVALFAPGFNDGSGSGNTPSRTGPPEPSRGTFSRQSSAAATSVALLDLYESDDEEAAKRREKETPWESLRHKSIKRNIIEQVKKENKWLDSIRSTFAGPSRPSIPDSGGFSEIDDEVSTVGSVPSTPVGKRRGHVRADSDIFVDNVTLRDLDTTAPLRVRNPSPRSAQQSQESADVPTSGVRRNFAMLKDEDEEKDRYTPLPGRLNESRSKSRSRGRSRSRSQSASPIKQMSSLPVTQGGNPPELVPIRRDVLPQSPSQLMSPPLESQMCFTPIPPFAAPGTVKTPRVVRPRSHSRTTASSPTKIPGPSNGQKLRSYNPPLLPDESVTSPFPEHTRGRLMKKPNSSATGSKTKARTRTTRSRTPAADRSTEGREKGSATTDSDQAMRKVDQIMAAGWSTRDVRRAEMMSPNAFGSHV